MYCCMKVRIQAGEGDVWPLIQHVDQLNICGTGMFITRDGNDTGNDTRNLCDVCDIVIKWECD